MKRSKVLKYLFTLATMLATVAVVHAASLVVVINEGIQGFDPGGTTRTAAANVYPNIFDTLIAKDADGELIPGLATAWEFTGDSTLTLNLREGVVWHDGQPFTAEDVAFTINRLASTPELVRHALFADVVNIEILDEFVIAITTEAPSPLLPNTLAASGAQILPKHAIEESGSDHFAFNPIGTGPYSFVEYRPDDRLVLKAFDDHWRGVAPYEDLTFRVIGENTTAVSELITGGVDLTAVPPSDTERVENSDRVSLLTQPTNRVVHWTFNTAEGQVTADPLVRKAITHALDPNIFIDVLENGFGTPTKIRAGQADAFKPDGYFGESHYDPELSVALLAEAGYGPGELTVVLGGASSIIDRAELTAAMLEAVGINPVIELYESSVWSSRYWTPGEFMNMAAVGSSNSTYDYGDTLTDLVCPTGAHSQRSHWCNEEFSDLVTAANSELDPDKRLEMLTQATEILMEEMPQAYVYNSASFLGLSNSVNWEPRADGAFFMFDAAPAND